MLVIILQRPIVAIGMASTALARGYKEVVAERYRWVSTYDKFLSSHPIENGFFRRRI
jgi:hypothetical protein